MLIITSLVEVVLVVVLINLKLVEEVVVLVEYIRVLLTKVMMHMVGYRWDKVDSLGVLRDNSMVGEALTP